VWRVGVLGVALVLVGMVGPSPIRAQSGTHVTYQAPALTVDARNARLVDVLNQIGAQVGFSVVQQGTPSMVSLSVRDVSVEEALRVLLAAENHTLLYRGRPDASGVVLDQIILLGASSPGPAVASERSGVTRPANPMSVAATAKPAAVTPERGAVVGPTADDPPETEAPTAAEVLRSHAATALRAAEMAGGPPGVAAPMPALDATVEAPRPAEGPAVSQETLAATTRRAQQSLKALVDALNTATRSLQDGPQPPPRSR
jgi:hypothetical protein